MFSLHSDICTCIEYTKTYIGVAVAYVFQTLCLYLTHMFDSIGSVLIPLDKDLLVDVIILAQFLSNVKKQHQHRVENIAESMS